MSRLLQVANYAITALLVACAPGSLDAPEHFKAEPLQQTEFEKDARSTTFTYAGEIDAALLEEIAARAGSLRVLELTSWGGDMMVAISITELLDSLDVVVVIKEYCFSACAHFIALPIDRLEIKDGAVIGFHHTSATLLARAVRPLMLEYPRFQELSEEYVDEQIGFYQREGLDQRWLFEADFRTVPQCTYLGIVQNSGNLVRYENEYDYLVLTHAALQTINTKRIEFRTFSEVTEESILSFKQRHPEFNDMRFLISNDEIIRVTQQDLGELQSLPLCGGARLE